MKRIVAFSLGIGMLMWVTDGSAQIGTRSSSAAFKSLSPGNQKIASALYEAQSPPRSTTGPTPLTRDQIAQMKQTGKGWGEIFQRMKAQGLVSAKNLGQVVSRYNHTHHLGHTEAGQGHGQSGGLSHGNDSGVSLGGPNIGHASSHRR